MVYVVLDRTCGQEAVRAARSTGASLWVGTDVFTSAEQLQLRKSGLSLTVFSYSLRSPSAEVIGSALATIEEHHPGEVIWIQHESEPA